MEWNELSRAEKIEHLFDYPYEERRDKVKELWGDEAQIYAEHIHFPFPAAWPDLVAVLKKIGKSQNAYVRLTEQDFKVITPDDWRRDKDETWALIEWHHEVMKSKELVLLEFDLYDKETLACNVCTQMGDRGDSDGYGVEPSCWANALFDFNGKVTRPFSPGFQWPKWK